MDVHGSRVIAALVVLWAASACGGSPVESSEPSGRHYLALGDSLAVGVQVGGPPGHGYAEQIFARLRVQDPDLRLVMLGCSGETTGSMLDGPGCRGKRKSQLAEAVAFLRAHDVALVTIDIGANDVLVGGGVRAIERNLPRVLVELRRAAGRDVPIVGMNYYDPLLASVWARHRDPARLRDEVAGVVRLNDRIEAVYRRAGHTFADVEAAFATTDVTRRPNGVPRNVTRVCKWTGMCRRPPAGADIHPNTAGYGAIAQAFLKVLQPDGGSR